MTKNIGKRDRVIRITIGVILFILAFTITSSTIVKVILVVAGLFCFYEAVSSWCLFYQLIGKNTCPVQE